MAIVLYVDDEELIQRAVRAWLVRKGHVVHTASDIAGAQNVLSANAVDGVIIDVWLGNESGFELQSWLDENQPHAARNVVFVTGDIIPSGSLARACDKLGRPVLGKPFDLCDLENYINGWR